MKKHYPEDLVKASPRGILCQGCKLFVPVLFQVGREVWRCQSCREALIKEIVAEWARVRASFNG